MLHKLSPTALDAYHVQATDEDDYGYFRTVTYRRKNDNALVYTTRLTDFNGSIERYMALEVEHYSPETGALLRTEQYELYYSGKKKRAGYRRK